MQIEELESDAEIDAMKAADERFEEYRREQRASIVSMLPMASESLIEREILRRWATIQDVARSAHTSELVLLPATGSSGKSSDDSDGALVTVRKKTESAGKRRETGREFWANGDSGFWKDPPLKRPRPSYASDQTDDAVDPIPWPLMLKLYMECGEKKEGVDWGDLQFVSPFSKNPVKPKLVKCNHCGGLKVNRHICIKVLTDTYARAFVTDVDGKVYSKCLGAEEEEEEGQETTFDQSIAAAVVKTASKVKWMGKTLFTREDLEGMSGFVKQKALERRKSIESQKQKELTAQALEATEKKMKSAVEHCESLLRHHRAESKKALQHCGEELKALRAELQGYGEESTESHVVMATAVERRVRNRGLDDHMNMQSA